MNVIGSLIGLVLVAIYLVSLGNLLRRKASYRLDFVTLKKIKAEVPDIVAKIRSSFETAKTDAKKNEFWNDMTRLKDVIIKEEFTHKQLNNKL